MKLSLTKSIVPSILLVCGMAFATAPLTTQAQTNCDINTVVLTETCAVSQIATYPLNQPYNWTVNGEAQPGTASLLTFWFPGAGTYTICASPAGSCDEPTESCLTIVIAAPCEECENFGFSLSSNIADDNCVVYTLIDSQFDMTDAVVSWNWGNGDTTPIQGISNVVAYQYDAPGIYTICATYYTPICTYTFCDSVFVGGCGAYPGCTDPEADNYNPNATEDDGSCIYTEPCADLMLQVNVEFVNCSTVVVTPFSGNNTPLTGVLNSPYGVVTEWPYTFEAFEVGDYQFCYSQVNECEQVVAACNIVAIGDLCLGGCQYDLLYAVFDGMMTVWTHPPLDTYQFTYNDSIVAESSMSISFPFNPAVAFTVCVQAMEMGCEDVDPVCFSYDPDTDVVGCMDSEAINYNPQATIIDFSCIYEGDCDISFYAVPDSLGNEDVLLIVASTNLADAVYVQWDFGDGNYSNDLYPQHTYADNGPWTLCVLAYFEDADSTGELSCKSYFCAEIDASMLGRSQGFSINVVQPQVLSVHATPFAERLLLWPNPANDVLRVQFDAAQGERVRIQVYDLTGKSIWNSALQTSPGKNLIQLPVSQWNAGIYLIQLSSENAQRTERFVVTR